MKMKILIGKKNPILRKKSERIEAITPEVRDTSVSMFAKMKEVDGIGLACPQIGKNIQLFVVDELAFNKERSKWRFEGIKNANVLHGFAFVNPTISTFPKDKNGMHEGCLSLPGWDGIITRSKRITIKAQDVNGSSFKLHAKGLLAKVIQHEYDHLQGTLISDKWLKPSFHREAKKPSQEKTGIVFFGDSEYSQIVLDKLKGTHYEPEIVIGKEIIGYKLEAKSYYLGITAAYGAIISEEVASKFKFGIINIHPSLLPKYRGPSPVQQTILNGDKSAGVSIIQVTKRIDAGPLLAQKAINVTKPYTTSELSTILFEIGTQLLKEILPSYVKGELNLTPQNDRESTKVNLIKKEDALVDWDESAQVIERKIRAYQPWPIAYTFFEHNKKTRRLQILKGKVSKNLTGDFQSGIIVPMSKELIVRCGRNTLLIFEVRPEGKKVMSGQEFLRGYAPTHFFRAKL